MNVPTKLLTIEREEGLHQKNCLNQGNVLMTDVGRSSLSQALNQGNKSIVHTTAAAPLVTGEGPKPSSRMVVGEAPGKTEAAQGRPFVGKSGALLDTALEEIGIDRSDIYITNIYKSLPLELDGSIRRPTFGECSDHWPFLKEEIELVNPEKILLLGRTAQDWFSLGPEEGLVKAWHPSYVLRKGGYGSETYKKWLEQLKPFAAPKPERKDG